MQFAFFRNVNGEIRDLDFLNHTQGNMWKKIRLETPKDFVEPFEIVVEAVVGDPFRGNIAVDDFGFHEACKYKDFFKQFKKGVLQFFHLKRHFDGPFTSTTTTTSTTSEETTTTKATTSHSTHTPTTSSETTHHSPESTTHSTTTLTTEAPSGLSGGAKAGIAFAVILILVLIMGFGFLYYKRFPW